MYVEGNRSMIVLKIIIAICLFTGIFSFFWYLQKTKIIEKGLTAARGSIKETTAKRQIEAHANLLIRYKKNKSKLERTIENPEKLYIYSRIGKLFRGLSFEAWAVLLVLTTAGAYLGTLLITRNPITGLLAAIGYYGTIKIIEMILARRNYKTIDKALLEFLNQLGNFSAIQGEITNVLHHTAQYTPPMLAEALEECYIEAQTTGNVSAALMGLSEQFEHEKFKEIIINLEVCSRYTANLKVIVDSLRRNLMDAKRASQERRAIADSAIIEMVILSVMLLIVLLVVDTMVKASIWDILFHSLVGYIALGVAGICYLIFGLAILKESSLKILPALIAILSFLLMIYVGKTYHPMAALHRTYIRIDGILHEKKVFFDYEETRRFLMSHGAADHFGSWIDPVKYLAIRISLAAIGFTVGIYVNAFLGLVGMVIGFFLLPLLLLYMNNKDNDAMTPQIQTLYSLLQVQIHAGVPMIDALSESYQSFPAGRLRNALSEFSTTIYFNGSFDKSLEELNEKFDNGFIDSLCIILLQARESGQAMELLRDISQQITDMQASLQLKKKEKLNRITTFCLMGIMGAMIGVALYAAITQMYASVGSF